MIRKVGSQWCLFTKDGSRKLGCHKTREGAVKQEQVIMRKSRWFRGATDGTVRTEKLYGRDHIVVPVVALVEGVIHVSNSPYPELVLAEEFGKSPQTWNGRPLMFDHPMNDQGEQVSANDPAILEKFAFGYVFNAVVDENKLKMEAWIDPERAKLVGAEGLLDQIKTGEKPTEVSVGVFITAEEKVGVFDGKSKYRGVWRDILPDHLAVLPKGIAGACSVTMGCGLPRAAGGPGSGNFGHGGRPGEVGGSGEGGGKSGGTAKLSTKEIKEVSKMQRDYSRAQNVLSRNISGPNRDPSAVSRAHSIMARIESRVQELGLNIDIPEGGIIYDERGKRVVGARSVVRRLVDLLERLDPQEPDLTDAEGLSDYEIRSSLEKALFPNPYPGMGYVKEVYQQDGIVIYCIGNEHYRRSFEVSDEGVIRFTSTPEEVKQVTSYEPVTASAARGNGETLNNEPAIGEDTMKTIKERVAALIASGKTCFTAASQEVLEKLPETEIKALEDHVAKATEPPKETPVAPAVTPAAAAPVATPVVPEKKEELTPEQKQAAFYKEFPDVAAIVNESKARAAARRTELVTKLKTAQSAYSEAELTAMPLEQLEKTASLVGEKKADFSPAAPRAAATKTEAAPPPIDMVARIKAARENKKSA